MTQVPIHRSPVATLVQQFLGSSERGWPLKPLEKYWSIGSLIRKTLNIYSGPTQLRSRLGLVRFAGSELRVRERLALDVGHGPIHA